MLGDADESSSIALEGFWKAVRHTREAALAAGHLRPIETAVEVVADGGVDFIVRSLSSLQLKEAATARRDRDFDPFLPPDPELLVADLSPTHRAVLNKFPAIDGHVLLVTRAFESQDAALTRRDVEALMAVMPRRGALAFYNAGLIAGASQQHKHIQVVPLPLAAGNGVPRGVPMVAAMRHRPTALGDLGLPFEHVGMWFEERLRSGSTEPTDRIVDAYVEAIGRLGLGRPGADELLRPYNLLLTESWMLVVPRRAERFEGMSVNALGYAGSLLVKSREQIERVRAVGPMRLLRELAEGWNAD